VLPSHSCGGTLQNVYLKLLHSSTRTSADGLNGEREVSRMTDEKGKTWSPFGMSKVRSIYGGRLFHVLETECRTIIYCSITWHN